MANRKSTDFSHLAGQTAKRISVTRQMTAAYHRAAGVRAEDDPELEEAAKPANEREQSEADELVDQMRRAYNRGLGLPDDDHENRESDDSAEWPLEEEGEQARAATRTRDRRGAR